MAQASSEIENRNDYRAYPPPIDLTALTNALNPRLLFDAIVTRWRVIVISVCVIPLLALIAALASGNWYTARSKILIQDSVAVNPFMSEMSVEWEINTRLPVVHDIVKSRLVAVDILTQLGEITEQTSEVDLEYAIEDFPGRIGVLGNPGGIIEISFQADSREKALNGLQRLMAVLQDEMLRPQKEALDSNVTFLGDQLSRVQAEIDAKIVQIQDFRNAGKVQQPEIQKILQEAYGSQVARFSQRQSDLAASEQRLSIATSRLQAYDPEVRRLQDSANRDGGELRRLEGIFQADHPEVQAARERAARSQAALDARRANPQGLDINTIENLLRTTGERMTEVLNEEITNYRNASNDVESIRQEIETLRASLAESEVELRSYSIAQQTLTQMEIDLESLRKVQADLFTRRQDSIVTRELTLADERRQVWVLDEPRAPRKKDNMGVKTAVMAGVMAGVMLALFIIAVAELLDKTVRLPTEAAKVSGVPTIAVIPYLEF